MSSQYPIFIKGDNLKIVYVNSDSLVSELKKIINFSEKFQYLTFIGKNLSENKKLINYGIKKYSTINLHVRGCKIV